jgi:hypothetical protein
MLPSSNLRTVRPHSSAARTLHPFLRFVKPTLAAFLKARRPDRPKNSRPASSSSLPRSSASMLRYLICRLTSLSIASRYEYDADAAMQASSLTWHVPCSVSPRARLRARTHALDGLRDLITRFGQNTRRTVFGRKSRTDGRRSAANRQ